MLFVVALTATDASAQPAELSLAPNPKLLNFGTASSNSPVTLYDTIKSVGAAGTKLGISKITITGSIYYSQISGAKVGDSIPAGNSELIGIQFLPFAYGTETGTLTVTTTGVDSGTQATSLTGISAIPSVSYSDSTMFAGTKVRVTDTSNVQYLYVKSTGIGPLVITGVSSIGLDGPRVCIITHVPAGTIPAGGMDSIGVRFSPDLEGFPDARIVIASNAVNEPSDTVTMEGMGILPHLSIDSGKTYPLPVTLNFDSIVIGASSCLQIQLWNPGSDTLAITKNYFQSADSDFTFTPLTGKDTLIPPGGTENIRVCFTPIKVGTRVANLRIRTDIPLTETTPPKDTSSFAVNIVGVGVPSAGQLAVTGPTSYDSVWIDSTSCLTDTIWNLGHGPITITNILVGTNGTTQAFSLPTYPTVPFVLGPDSSKVITVCAEPKDTGLCTGFLDVTASYGGGVEAVALHNVSVYGWGIGSEYGLQSPFLPVTCVGDSSLGIVYVTNDGDVADVYTASLAQHDSADFKFITQTTSPTVPPGGTFSFNIHFIPTKTGIEETEVIITRRSDGESSTGFYLTPSGGAATIAGTGSSSLTSVGTTSAPFAALVRNTGTCDWETGIPVVTAPFAYVGGDTTIASGDSAELMFTFSPTSDTTATQTVQFPGAMGTSIPAANVVLTGNAAAAGVPIVSSSNGYTLDQNYPNPFNGSSDVEITLPVGGQVNLSIINVQGQVVQTVLNQHFDAGTFDVTLHSESLASGTYYYQMTAGDVTLTRQMVVIK